MQLAAWNINSLRKRLNRLVAWTNKTGVDVVCLQETKCVDEKFPSAELEAAGLQAVYFGQKSYNGVAILSRTPITDVVRGLPGIDPQSRVITATTSGLRVICIYAPNGQAVGAPAYEYKLEWFRRLRAFVADELQRHAELIVCGDFNVGPQPEDVHDPRLWTGAIMFSQPEREAVQRLIELGLRDTLRLHHPEGGLFSWWDYRMLSFQKNRGLRIDYILASASTATRCTGASIDREARKGPEPSDHAPVLATFA